MAKVRISIPTKISDKVLKEFNHRCAKCGTDNPHLHHIDENPSNNDPLNLIPLCPCCGPSICLSHVYLPLLNNLQQPGVTDIYFLPADLPTFRTTCSSE